MGKGFVLFFFNHLSTSEQISDGSIGSNIVTKGEKTKCMQSPHLPKDHETKMN
jgi:hypothetical protein